MILCLATHPLLTTLDDRRGVRRGEIYVERLGANIAWWVWRYLEPVPNAMFSKVVRSGQADNLDDAIEAIIRCSRTT